MAVFAEACRRKGSRFSGTLSSAQGNLLYMFALANTQSGADGHVSGSVDYDIFGEPVTETGVFASASGGSGGISSIVFAYVGKPYDSVTGLSDYGFRDYAPTLARFTTVDPIRDGSNWYAYCNSDPVNYVDAWGLCTSDSATVQSGDTLGNMTWAYNKEHGTSYTAADIAAYNNITNPDLIHPGEIINFPINNTQTTTKKQNQNTIQTIMSSSDSPVMTITPVQEISTADKLKNALNTAGDVLSLVSIGLNISSTVSILTGNVMVAGCLDMIAAGCDILSTGLYLASGDNTKAAIAFTATFMDFIPGPYKFNKGANRYISSATGKFVSTTLGKQNSIIPKVISSGLNFLNIK